MQRPFATRCLATLSAGLLEVRIAFCSAPQGKALAAIEAAQQGFFELANTGALCGASIAPEQSGISDIAVWHRGPIVTWQYAQVRIDAHSLTLLINLVHRLHDQAAPVADLQINWDMSAHIADPTRAQFPARHGALPFDVTIEEGLGTFDVVLDFAKPQPPERLEAVIELVGTWFIAVNLGAYGDESSPAPFNRVLFSSEPMTICDDALVWYLDRWASTPFALDGLVNVVAYVDRIWAPVVALEVAE